MSGRRPTHMRQCTECHRLRPDTWYFLKSGVYKPVCKECNRKARGLKRAAWMKFPGVSYEPAVICEISGSGAAEITYCTPWSERPWMFFWCKPECAEWPGQGRGVSRLGMEAALKREQELIWTCVARTNMERSLMGVAARQKKRGQPV